MHRFANSECLACGRSDLVPALSLPKTPLTDRYLSSAEDSISLPYYPLTAYFCSNCSHLQLGFQVSPDESYTDYIYNSAVTIGLNQEFDDYATKIVSESEESEKIKLLDIGSNDGSFLYACLKQGIDAYGIEPAEQMANQANKNSLKTLNSYFSKSAIQDMHKAQWPKKFDVITFNNVFANISDPLAALHLAKSLLKNSRSRIFIQTGYHPVQFAKGLFDYIYHEHYSYFTTNSMLALASRAGIKLKSSKILSLRGGSIRFELAQDNSLSNSFESFERFSSINDYMSINTLIHSSAAYIKNLLMQYKANNYTVYGFGASHSTGTLVHTFGLYNYIDVLLDDNPNKHNRFMPGTTLMVQPLKEEWPDSSVIIILAWQYFDAICTRIRSSGFNGTILKPVIP
jgi:hypothetical protein